MNIDVGIEIIISGINFGILKFSKKKMYSIILIFYYMIK